MKNQIVKLAAVAFIGFAAFWSFQSEAQVYSVTCCPGSGVYCRITTLGDDGTYHDDPNCPDQNGEKDRDAAALTIAPISG